MPDIAIPIVFPDYMIAVNTPATTFDIPDIIPGFDILPDEVTIPGTNNKVPELGHAGILFINSKTGTTKYYEYGRYRSSTGNVRKMPVRDVKIDNAGHPTHVTLAFTLSQIAAKSGQNGRILGAYIEVPGYYQAMLDYASKRMKDNANPNRKPYDLLSNSCNHFMQGVLDAANVATPAMIDPRPVSYIEELRDDHKDLDFNPRGGGVILESEPSNDSGWFGNFLGQPANL